MEKPQCPKGPAGKGKLGATESCAGSGLRWGASAPLEHLPELTSQYLGREENATGRLTCHASFFQRVIFSIIMCVCTYAHACACLPPMRVPHFLQNQSKVFVLLLIS